MKQLKTRELSGGVMKSRCPNESIKESKGPQCLDQVCVYIRTEMNKGTGGRNTR